MIKHMIIWKLKGDVSDKGACMSRIKQSLEGLLGRIDGLLEMKIQTVGLTGSSGDLLMDSTFRDAEALTAYQVSPLHQEIANTLVRPFVETRLSFDYEI